MNFANRLLLYPIIMASRFFRVIAPRTCRFHPSCSEYAVGALRQYNFFKAVGLIIRRLFRCHPWSVGGYDPVPENTKGLTHHG